MSTTSLKLPEDLKARAASAAKSRGISTHAFMVEAIRQAAAATENRARFIADAKAARSRMLRTGKGYAADDVHAYLKSKISRTGATKPKTKPWRG